MKNNNLDNVIKTYINDTYTISNLNIGHSSEKWVVHSKNKIFLLKAFNNISDNRIEFINYIQENLSIYSPNIIRNNDNKMYTRQDNTVYVLYDYLKGKILIKHNLSYEDLEKIGLFLGEIHEKLKLIEIPKYFIDIYNLKIKYDNKNKIEKIIKLYDGCKNNDYYKILIFKYKILNDISMSTVINESKNLSEQLVHGDFYLDNIIIKNNTFKILDLDKTCIFYKMYEVVRGMMMIGYDKKFSDNENMKRILSFIRGYENKSDIEDLNCSIDIYIYIYWLVVYIV